ncbi:MAG: hypothetical protein ACJ77A_09140 [Actinomycetota bacterium]
MPDLDDRFRSLDGVGSPDLWDRVKSWDPGQSPKRTSGRRRRVVVRRIAAATVTLAVAAAAIGFAAVAFEGSAPKPKPTPTPALQLPVRNGPLVFAAGSPRSRVYSVDPDGSALHAISPPSIDASQPAVSPDGARIAFVSRGPQPTNIYVMNSDGTGIRQLTGFAPSNNLHLSSGDGSDPSWSPDGRNLAFTSSRDGCMKAFVMAADGSGQRPVTGCGSFTRPAWSPNGIEIAVGGAPRDDRHGIWLMNADGTAGVGIEGTRPSDRGPVAWSPDGEHIAFRRGSSVVSIPSGFVPIRAPVIARCPDVSCGGGPFDVTFSPDGRSVALAARGLWVAARGTGSARRVPLPPGLRPTTVAWPPAAGTARVAPPTDVVTVSRRYEHGAVRCVLAVPSAVLPGVDLPMRMVIENLTNRTVHVAERLEQHTRVTRGDGQELWDSNDAFYGFSHGPPALPPPPLAPRSAIEVGPIRPAIQWDDATEVRTECLEATLPGAVVQVVVPGAAPSSADAVTRAREVAGSPLGDCVPPPDGTWAIGTAAPVQGDGFRARCRAVISKLDGFDVVRLQLVAPPTAVVPFGRYFAETFYRLPAHPGVVVLAAEWRFVITAQATQAIEAEYLVSGCDFEEFGSLPSSDFSSVHPGPCRATNS